MRKMKGIVSIVIVELLLLSCLVVLDLGVQEAMAAGGSFGGGDGTTGNPYIIEDVDDLQNMSANLSAHYVLANDIDASATAGWNPQWLLGAQMARWTMDETQWNGTQGEVVDSSNYGNNGTANGDANTTADGVFGRAGIFDGVGDNVTAGNDESLRISGDLTLSLWLNATDISNEPRILGWGASGESSNTNYQYLFIIRSDGRLRAFHESGSGTNTAIDTTFSYLNATQVWYHFSIVRNVTAKEYSFYVNGTHVQTIPYTTDPEGGTSGGVYIGSDVDGSSAFNGSMDDVRVYRAALNGSEIVKLYNGEDYNPSYPIEPLGFKPIGNSSAPFNGSLDGAGYTIFNLTIDRPTEDMVGLFGYLDSGAAVFDLGLANTSIAGDDNVGAVAGRSEGAITNVSIDGDLAGDWDLGGIVGYNNGGTITNVTVSGNVTSIDQRTGGITGYNKGTITNATCYGNVTGPNDNVGGIAGYNTGTITNTANYGKVTGDGNVGGIAGYNSASGTIASAANHGNVSSTGDMVAGIAGSNSGTVVSVVNCGSISAHLSYTVAGIVGDNSGSVTNATNFGDIDGSGYVSGIVAHNDAATITNAVNYCNVEGYELVGGIAGMARWSGNIITNTTNHGNVTGTGRWVGGILGWHYGGSTVADATNYGNVTGTDAYVGGIMGINEGTTIVAVNYGEVTGAGDYVGGIAGDSVGTISGAVNYGDVTGTYDYVGGIAGRSDGRITDRGLVGYWQMDEASWDGTSGEVLDSSGHGNDGTAAGDANTGAGGVSGRMGVFDGNGDYADCGSDGSLWLSRSVSISFWMNATNLSNTPRMVVFGASGETYATNYLYEVGVMPDGRIRLFHEYAAGSNVDSTTTGQYIKATGVWYHISAVRDDDAMEWRVYVNGTLVETVGYGKSVTGGTDGKFVIGSAADGTSSFNGTMDEVKIYNFALNNSEALNIYGGGSIPPILVSNHGNVTGKDDRNGRLCRRYCGQELGWHYNERSQPWECDRLPSG